MGVRSRLSRSDGNVSAEAAVGIGVIIVVMIALIQALGLGLWQIRARAAVTEALRIATASGEPAQQVALARDFLREQLPHAKYATELADEGVTFHLRQQMNLPLLRWRPALEVSGFAHWQDPWTDF